MPWSRSQPDMAQATLSTFGLTLSLSVRDIRPPWMAEVPEMQEHFPAEHPCTSKKRPRSLKGREGDRDRMTRLGLPGIRTTWGEMVRRHTTHICETTRFVESSIIRLIYVILPLVSFIPVIAYPDIYYQWHLQLCSTLHKGSNLRTCRI